MEKNYQKIFESFSIACLLLESRNGELFIRNTTDRFCHLSSLTRKKLIGSPVMEVFPGIRKYSEFPVLLDRLEKSLRSGKNQTIPILRFDLPVSGGLPDKERYWCIHFIPFNGQEPPEKQLILVKFLDKTREVLEERERHRAQEELKKGSEERKKLIDENPDGLFSLDSLSNFISVNEGLSKITQLPREDLLDMNLLDLCPDEDREKINGYFEKVRSGGDLTFELLHRTRSGEIRILNLSLMRMETQSASGGVYGIAKDITENRRTRELILKKERELERNENKYKALVQAAFDIVGVLDLEGNYKFVSQSAATVLGIPPDFFLGKNAFDFIHPDDKERVREKFASIDKQRKIKVEPFRFLDKDRNWRWIETNVTNLMDDPNVEGVVTNSREVTEIVKKNLEIQKLYERYKLAAEATGDLVYDWDLVTDSMKRFFKENEKLFGYDLEQLDRRHFWREHMHPDDLEALGELLKRTLANPERTRIRAQYRFKRADGTYAHIIDRATILRNEKAEAIRLIGATSDVSGIISRRNALRVANQRFSYAMKATQEMIWDWDIKLDVIERSNSFKRIFGYDPRQKPSVKNFWFDRICTQDRERIRHSLQEALRDPEVRKWKQEYKFRKVSGEKAYVIDRGYIIRNTNGEAIRMVGATLDVTASRRMLKEIEKQNRVLREIAWEQAHVVRAPLARLRGLLNLYEEDTDETWDREEVLQLIKEAAEELDEIVVNIIRKTGEIGTER